MVSEGDAGRGEWLGMSGGYDQLILWRSCYPRDKQPSDSLHSSRKCMCFVLNSRIWIHTTFIQQLN
jgi:hypothetical protein